MYTQATIIATMVEYILYQSQKQFDFNVADVKEATINNGCLYLTVNGDVKVIQLN